MVNTPTGYAITWSTSQNQWGGSNPIQYLERGKAYIITTTQAFDFRWWNGTCDGRTTTKKRKRG